MPIHTLESFSLFSHIVALTGAARNVLVIPYPHDQASHDCVFRVLWCPRQGWFGRDLENTCPLASRLR
jgi:hypothetical protein